MKIEKIYAVKKRLSIMRYESDKTKDEIKNNQREAVRRGVFGNAILLVETEKNKY